MILFLRFVKRVKIKKFFIHIVFDKKFSFEISIVEVHLIDEIVDPPDRHQISYEAFSGYGSVAC